jgi:hypothetical protein
MRRCFQARGELMLVSHKPELRADIMHARFDLIPRIVDDAHRPAQIRLEGFRFNAHDRGSGSRFNAP